MKKIIFSLVCLVLMSISAMAQTGTFKTAALNVDGMPKEIRAAGIIPIKLNPDAKEGPGATAIGKKLKTMGYDVVGLSEDFNYHSEIWNEAWNNGVDEPANGIYHMNATTHRGNIASTAQAIGRIIGQTSPVFDIDGLCLFYKCATIDQGVLESSERWTHWNDHYGYTSDGADGLIDKGYRYYTVKLKDTDFEFDLYILHMDAETSPADNAARESQIDQLAAAIIATNNKRPIIVMGDTNCRYTRDRIKSHFIDVLNLDPRFTCKDPWIEHEYNGIYPAWGTSSLMVGELGYQKGEVVDKVFYINNTDSKYRIKSNSYLQDITFVNEAGEPLADHWPIVIDWTYYPSELADQYEDNTTVENPFGDNTEYYFRNVETGEFLKSGGMWGTHAMTGVYGEPINISALNDGTFTLRNFSGYIGSNGYMDCSTATRWQMVGDGDFYSIVCNDNGTMKALAGNIGVNAYGPNQHVADLVTYNANDNNQKWQLLTKEDLIAEMATVRNNEQFNATFLMKDPNFDRGMNHAAWNNTITSNASKMWSNLGGLKNNGASDVDGAGDYGYDNGNLVGEAYVDKFSTGSYATTWEISQTLTGVPNGKYKVQMLGYFRVNTAPISASDGTGVYLSANNSSVKLPDMFSVKQTAISGGTTNSGYSYPNSMAEASRFFNAGHYANEVEVEVTNGTLKVGVSKTTTSKGSTIWTCFDNFQLIYLGDGESHVGDITRDGKNDVQDVTALVDIILGKAVEGDANNYDYVAADVDGDGKFTVSDVTALVDIILGK